MKKRLEKKNTGLKIALFCIAYISVFTMINNCSMKFKTEFRNYDENTRNDPHAKIFGIGMQLYLVGAKRQLVDLMQLEDGDYLIGFRQTSSMLNGAARCKLLKGNSYKITIIGRKQLKHSKTTSLIGKCEKIID